jgi:hypothetical protein
VFLAWGLPPNMRLEQVGERRAGCLGGAGADAQNKAPRKCAPWMRSRPVSSPTRTLGRGRDALRRFLMVTRRGEKHRAE